MTAALVVFLRGVNVGGHRVFRPAELARELAHLDVVNIGAAGTFVVRRPGSRAEVRAEFAKRLPFDTHVAICPGREILGLIEKDYFPGMSVRKDIVRFVSVFSRNGAPRLAVPAQLPVTGPWLVKIVSREKRFVVGVYRRQMKTIRYLGELDRLVGTPVTTRNWNTITAVAKVLSTR